MPPSRAPRGAYGVGGCLPRGAFADVNVCGGPTARPKMGFTECCSF